MTGAAHAKAFLWALPVIVVGAVGLIIFIRMQIRRASPLLDVSLLTHNRYFTLSCLAAMGNYAATFGIIFLPAGATRPHEPFSAVRQGTHPPAGRPSFCSPSP